MATEQEKKAVQTAEKIDDLKKDVKAEQAVEGKAAEALAEAAEREEEEGSPADPHPPVGEPIECVVREKYQDDAGRIKEVGEPAFYQRRKGIPFPIKILEPLNRSLAKELAGEAAEAAKQQAVKLAEAAKRREAFARLANETEV